jgi:DNA (cytosine-5)-methyltransferase 1
MPRLQHKITGSGERKLLGRRLGLSEWWCGVRYLSMFSGIEAATVAWHPLGWTPAAFCEIDKFPSAVLAHHYPHVPNLGDVTKVDFDAVGHIDLAVFGSPCQSFSIAGKRLGLDDPRGNLALYALGVVSRLRPRWFVFENVPGLLSSGGGRDFGAFLGTVGKCGYQCAWRVLDAQYFGVAQRRRRVFVVGYLGDWRRAAAVLFERESLRGDTAPRRQAGPGVAALTANGVGTCGADDNQAQAGHLIAKCLNGKGGAGRIDGESETFVTHSPRADGFDASEDGTGRGTPLVPVQAVALRGREGGATAELSDVPSALRASGGGGDKAHVLAASMVRRLTPRECERLQGFPDDYTLIPYRNGMAADGPRYKALGNSMAVPVMAWIGRRIAMVDQIESLAA